MGGKKFAPTRVGADRFVEFATVLSRLALPQPPDCHRQQRCDDRKRNRGPLPKDYSSLLGEAFVASRLKVIFPTVDGIEICRVDVSSAHKPIFIEVADKNGQATEKFYVRNGNSSREMSPSETHSYIADRFS